MKFLILIFFVSVLPIFSNGQQLNDGSVVKSLESDEIYLVMNRHLHLISNIRVFKNLFVSSTNIQTVSAISLEVLPKGESLKNGRLIKSTNTAIFLQYDKYKIHIPNPETFNAYSFDWNKIVNMDDEEISKYETLLPISSVIQSEKRTEPKPCGTRD